MSEPVTVELAEPAVLWSRWGAVGAAFAALGYDDVWWTDAHGAHHDDHGGNWGRLVLVADGRAVLFGYDHEYSGTVDASPPIDLLAGAPAWLPWPELLRHAEDDQLGYVYWHEHGSWSRVPYPDGIADGLVPTVGAVLDAGRARRELAEVVFGWAHHDADGEAERGDVATHADRLLAAAADRVVDAGVLAGLLARIRSREVDLPAGVLAATRAGLTPGAVTPVVPAAAEVPPRRVRTLSVDQHERLAWAAMREAREIPRPRPAVTDELEDLVEWARARAPGADGRSRVIVEALDGAMRQISDDLRPVARAGESSRDVFALVERLRAAEADPRHGHWIFLRLETTPDGFTVERRYDSWPDWMGPLDSGPWLSHLRAEMDVRAAAFRPAWSALLDPEVAYLGPPESRAGTPTS
ncbi:hypothetical protein [Micromonospora sp. NBS 11-29]|uniref:hypothetical protein n=1 Tax=Micromonospora sp. NBS 11-29 TaxID=1960879 RepID=UPI0020CD69B5|nr:hypothetical protein [Micromonospora sp. NBS 11-29]